MHFPTFFSYHSSEFAAHSFCIQVHSQTISQKTLTLILIEVAEKTMESQNERLDSEIFHFVWFRLVKMSQFFLT